MVIDSPDIRDLNQFTEGMLAAGADYFDRPIKEEEVQVDTSAPTGKVIIEPLKVIDDEVPDRNWRLWLEDLSDRTIDVSASQATSCAFGGPNLDELYITSAGEHFSAADRAREPLSGSLFRVRPGVTGVPMTLFAGWLGELADAQGPRRPISISRHASLGKSFAAP